MVRQTTRGAPPVDALQPPLVPGIALVQQLPGRIAAAALVIGSHDDFGRAGINDHPAARTGAEAAVKIALKDIVGVSSPFERRVQIGLGVGIRPHDHAMPAFVVRDCRDRGLNRVVGPGP